MFLHLLLRQAFSSYSSGSKPSPKSGSEDLKIYTPNNFHNGLHINPGPQHCHNNTISREYIPVKTPLRDVLRNPLSGTRLTQMHRFKCPPRAGAKIGPCPRCANSFSAGVGELWEVGLLAWQMDKGIASSMPSTHLRSCCAIFSTAAVSMPLEISFCKEREYLSVSVAGLTRIVRKETRNMHRSISSQTGAFVLKT